MKFRPTMRSAKTIRLLVTMMVALVATACATTPTPPPAPPPAPPSVALIEGRPEPESAINAFNKAVAELKDEKAISGRLAEENAELRKERENLQRELAEKRGKLLALGSRVDELARDQQEAMDALLASEIEKATLERRLLEIRLADLRRAEEEVSR